MTAGIILAAGKGTRMGLTNQNKVALDFAGKPMVVYAVELLAEIANPIVVVTGKHKQSVEKKLENYHILFAHQQEQLGTGHAVQTALHKIPEETKNIIVGYGDHMMFYTKESIFSLLALHEKQNATISLITTIVSNPSGYGRIVRNREKDVVGIIEEKDATEDQKKIDEINAGLYIFDYEFLKENIDRVKKSEISGEYYLTDLIALAIEQEKSVIGLTVAYEQVGIGINKPEELIESQKLFA